MKKILFTLSVFLIQSLCYACDICGCGVGNTYIGILPDFNTRIIGLRYRYNSLLTHVGVGGSTTYLTTNETYQTAELWSGWNVRPNVRMMASVPYSFNEKENGGNTTHKNGISDVSITGFYQLINQRKSLQSSKLLIQSLWLGGGIKLPTGKYNPADKVGTNENTNLFQLGTGSLDFLLNAMYDIRLQDVGINAFATYKVNTSNRYNYQYGNKASISTQAYYKFRLKKQINLSPNVGIQYEQSQQDKDRQFAVDVSGGNLLMGTSGTELVLNKVAIGSNWQTPLSQNLGKGFIKAHNRVMVHVSVMF